MAKRRTHEEFVELINDINPNIEIIGKYVNAKTKIECKCKKCGHKWSPLANSVVQGFGCPNCQLISMKFSHEEFVDKMTVMNKERCNTDEFKEKARNRMIYKYSDKNIESLEDLYRKVIYIKTEQYETLVSIKDFVDKSIRDNIKYKKISVQFDFNPVNGF